MDDDQSIRRWNFNHLVTYIIILTLSLRAEYFSLAVSLVTKSNLFAGPFENVYAILRYTRSNLEHQT